MDLRTVILSALLLLPGCGASHHEHAPPPKPRWVGAAIVAAEAGAQHHVRVPADVLGSLLLQHLDGLLAADGPGREEAAREELAAGHAVALVWGDVVLGVVEQVDKDGTLSVAVDDPY